MNIAGIHVVAVADIDVPKAREALDRVGWPHERAGARTINEAARTGATCVLESAISMIEHPAVEVVVGVTGNPFVGVEHALAAVDNCGHIVMLNADCLVGPLLSQRARAAGVVSPWPAVTSRLHLRARRLVPLGRVRCGCGRQGHQVSAGV